MGGDANLRAGEVNHGACCCKKKFRNFCVGNYEISCWEGGTLVRGGATCPNSVIIMIVL